MIEIILAVEDADLRNTVKRCLDLNCRASTTATHNGHLLANRAYSVVGSGLHKAHAVGNSSRQMPVIVHDCVYRTAHLSSGRELIEILPYQCFVGHRNIGTAHLKRSNRLYACLNFVGTNLECKISVIAAEFRKRFVVHGRRSGMTDWIRHQADKLSVAGYSFRHMVSPFLDKSACNVLPQ